jgi:iron(III) transport system permease protein
MALALTQARYRLARMPWLVVALALFVTCLVLLPPVYLVLRATESDSVWESLSRDSTVDALIRTVQLTAAVTATCVALGVPLAWLTGRTDLPLRHVWTVVLALPLAVPSFVGGFVMVSALSPRGLVQDLLEPLGVERLPSIYGFWGAWFVLSVLSYPYVFLQVRAALNRTNPAMEEAARSLGKSPLETFFRVNVPLMRPAISAGALLIALYTVSEFGAVSMLRYDTLTPLVYIQYTTSFDRASAAVIGLPLIGLAACFVALDGMTRGQARYYTRGQARPAHQLKLGAWKWPAFAFCSLVAAAGIGVPVGVILYWLLKGLAENQETGFLLESIVNSGRVALFAAILAALACLPIALLSVRHASILSSAFEKLAYFGQSLPAITIALALVFFASRYVEPLYQTVWILVFAYALRFMPEALGATRGALLQVNPNTEEAARSLGSGPLRTFLRVTVPQVVPGMSAGALLVFLTAMKELPIAILLSPIGFDTLALEIWSATSEAFYTRAALPSLILLAMSGVAVLLMLRRERLA